MLDVFSLTLAGAAIVLSIYSVFRARRTYGIDLVNNSFVWLSSALLQYPALRSYFEDPATDPSDLDADSFGRVMTIAEHMADMFDLFDRAKHGTFGWLEAWRHDTIARSQTLRRFVLENEGWYHEVLVAEVRRAETAAGT